MNGENKFDVMAKAILDTVYVMEKGRARDLSFQFHKKENREKYLKEVFSQLDKIYSDFVGGVK